MPRCALSIARRASDPADRAASPCGTTSAHPGASRAPAALDPGSATHPALARSSSSTLGTARLHAARCRRAASAGLRSSAPRCAHGARRWPPRSPRQSPAPVRDSIARRRRGIRRPPASWNGARRARAARLRRLEGRYRRHRRQQLVDLAGSPRSACVLTVDDDGSASAIVERVHAIESAIGCCHATPYSHIIDASPHTPVTVLTTPAGPCVTRQSSAKSQSVSWFSASFS